MDADQKVVVFPSYPSDMEQREVQWTWAVPQGSHIRKTSRFLRQGLSQEDPRRKAVPMIPSQERLGETT
ncbi:hypothetical protein MYU51_000063 [Penicillium brevicompactum]